METNLKGVRLPRTISITFNVLIDKLGNSEFKKELTDTMKEVIKQLVSDGVEKKKAIEIIESCFGYRMVGHMGDEIYYFLKND